jgi:hypothetical protein
MRENFTPLSRSLIESPMSIAFAYSALLGPAGLGSGAGLANEKRKVVQTPDNDSHLAGAVR